MSRPKSDTVGSFARHKEDRLLCKIEMSEDDSHARWVCTCEKMGPWQPKRPYFRSKLALAWNHHVELHHPEFEL